MHRTIGLALAVAAFAFAATTADAAGPREYKSEAAARKHCPRDEIVYSVPKERVYHRHEAEDYGKVKGGRYVCLREAERGGWHETEHH